ncbi:MAG TPA: hypothetical protein VMI54_01355 [Polyangiaceae bacterium]|nr:hypothetical protein [Polyangiaceae bacterium]
MSDSFRWCARAFAAVCALAALACSGSHFSDAPPASLDVTQACDDLARARCNLRVACTDAVESSGAALLRAYGDMDTCLAREALQCQNQATASGSGATPTHVEGCVTAVESEACGDFFDNVPPPACLPGGSRAAGEPCAFNAQCSSGYCGGTANSICGSCGTAPGAGGDCTTSNCGRDLVCIASTNLCESRADTGAACSTSEPCRSDLNCIAATDAASTDDTTSTCQTAGGDGAPCGSGTSGCDGMLGLYCGGTKGARVCTGVSYAANGEPCGMLADGTHAQCVAGDCYTDTGLAAATDLGVCKGFSGDGEPCDAELGPTCLAPARCVTTNGSVGVCTVALGASCD